MEFLTALVIATAVYFGGQRVLSGQMTAGELTAFFTAFALMMHPLRTLNDLNIKIHQAAAAADRIFEVLSWKSRITEPDRPLPLKGFSGKITFEQVSFAYPDTPQRQILSDVSFEVPCGSIVALAGASGSGKSSLIQLLPRLFDVTSGRIAIDGKDVRDFSIEDLRRLIAIVSQDVFLFNDTIEENIRCGRLSATREEIREAARLAHAHEFIEALPAGYQTVIGDRGLKLSGGERQRISIARAFLRDSPILILDEATSSLDTQSERAVQGALDELMVGKTTLVVAHRLSTIQNASQIIVMKDGRIIERGHHEELVRLGGEYARFHEIPP